MREKELNVFVAVASMRSHNGYFEHSIFAGKFCPKSMFVWNFSHGFNLFCSQSGKWMVRPGFKWWRDHGSVFFAIRGIFFLSSPAKILYSIIQRIAVYMQTHHAARSGANKRIQNQSMNFCVIRFPVFSQRNRPAFVRGVNPAFVSGQYAAVLGCAASLPWINAFNATH